MAGLRSPTLRETNEKVNAQPTAAQRSLKSSAVPRREAASFNNPVGANCRPAFQLSCLAYLRLQLSGQSLTRSVRQRMTSARRSVERFHHQAGCLSIALLMLPILVWVWLAARESVFSVLNGTVPRWVLSGELFSEKFDTGHAGSALDQPTIGKWLFWFSVMAASSLPYASAVGWLSDRGRKSGHLAFGISAGILCLFLLCILSWPLSWLIQYVCSMGFTPRRSYGLLYAVAGGLLVIGFLSWAVREPKKTEAEPGAAPNGGPATRVGNSGATEGPPSVS